MERVGSEVEEVRVLVLRHISAGSMEQLSKKFENERTLLGKFKPRKTTSINTVQKEHKNPNKLIDAIVKKLLKWEIRKISNGKKMNFGSSCIIVAKKMKSHKEVSQEKYAAKSMKSHWGRKA